MRYPLLLGPIYMAIDVVQVELELGMNLLIYEIFFFEPDVS
jgi:hypothetical protein